MNITVWYSVLKPIKKDFNTQEMRIYPGSTEEKILWSKDIQISDAGIAVATAKFPIAAVRARITVCSSVLPNIFFYICVVAFIQKHIQI